MKGLTKTIVALALVMTLIATMGMSAMAEQTPSYSTKTTYQADGKISVEANATNLAEGDIVTYVATTDATDVNKNTIVYINQAEVKTGETGVTFNYTTEVTNINASMFFGGSKENTRQEATAVGGFNVTVRIGSKEKTISVNKQANENTVVIRKFDLSGFTDFSAKDITGVTFEDQTINDFCADATTLMVSTNLINKAGVLEIKTKDAVAFEKPRISATTKVVDGDLIAVAKAPAGKKFGIVVYTGEKPTTLTHAYTETTGLLVLPALGKNVEGIYAVEVEDIVEFIGDKSFNVAAYAFDGTKAELSDLVKSITIAE